LYFSRHAESKQARHFKELDGTINQLCGIRTQLTHPKSLFANV
jgi:hypothetical protein